MAVTGVKYEQGNSVYASNFFPVRSILKQNEDGGGAWRVSYREEELQRFNAYLINKPDELDFKPMVPRLSKEESEFEEDISLDGFFLLQHCCVYDPSDLCSINVFGCGLKEAKPEDFEFFNNVIYINAGDNLLPLDIFNNFPQLKELELQSCQIESIPLTVNMFPHLMMLDLSYNDLEADSFWYLGLIPNLRVLHLTGNDLKEIKNIDEITFSQESRQFTLFSSLEILMLNNNKLVNPSTFTNLSKIKSLQHLNLENNNLHTVPHLKDVKGHIKEVSPSQLNSAVTSDTNIAQQRLEPTPVSVSVDMYRAIVDAVSSLDQSFYFDESTTGPHFHLQEPSQESVRDAFVEPFDMATLQTELAETQVQYEDVLEKLNELSSKKTVARCDSPKVDNTQLPFETLRFINLAQNQFVKEESLLPLALWPNLSEVVLHGNPLMTCQRGGPQLLKDFLGKQLGIKLYHEQPCPLTKQPLSIRQTKNRKVSTYIPQIMKPSIEDRIGPVSHDSPCMRDRGSTFTKTTPKPRSDKVESDTNYKNNTKNNNNVDPFFVTQVQNEDDGDGTSSRSERVMSPPLDNQFNSNNKNELKDKRFKGYEELMTEDDTGEDHETVALPSDMPRCVQALRHALGHELICREAPIKAPVCHGSPSKKRVTLYMPTCNKTKDERVDEILTDLREMQTFDDVPLIDILQNSDKTTHKKAIKLIDSVEKQYNKVMDNSSQIGLDLKSIINESDNLLTLGNTLS